MKTKIKDIKEMINGDIVEIGDWGLGSFADTRQLEDVLLSMLRKIDKLERCNKELLSMVSDQSQLILDITEKMKEAS